MTEHPRQVTDDQLLTSFLGGNMSTVSLNGLSHAYENTVSPSVHPFNLFIDDGEFLVLYGPSGSGKSTILRMLHGLEAPKTGTILIDGNDVTHAAVNDRDVTLALESYALYPHMSVRDNLGFALRVDGLPAEEIRDRVESVTSKIGLRDILDDVPGDLSALQRQTIALARAVVRQPKVLIMDEPVVNLVPEHQADTLRLVKDLQQEFGLTTLYATANLEDAKVLGDRIAFLDHGRLIGVEKPEVAEALVASISDVDS
ncbi:ABC transporter ATP-binding protein [Brevibacterium aurantiacum]|uniref:ABC transporter ATP-binding protein n=1 Tax=Brevibacterium aurantiacum TaxID=273384 RepID=A0A2A3YTE2_BREAU|nr:ABC transporter ATP-binding protein [Brevibacterium aurantiacum]AZL10446.1 ABC transporter ATP-binding protein [Brevibacterium aurantiacum]AZL14131.1 ABC transporter ATP-binding protein [Brevibacterium aurantiacum]AZT98450.1 ABC transporter ATP-binding protein [Brevibacterium aurantiacum]MDN5712079.1 ABC transporter ATP-binding protein [Brevibacterium aurantiacum]MDN5774424.1 ABC transporter ATP-binding protein [Brevibacterium aurantiacum]